MDGKNNASLLCPSDNAANLPAGFVYTKYDWSLYHHENPFFGHFGVSPDGTQLLGQPLSLSLSLSLSLTWTALNLL